jgi:hypothetical protein
VIQEAASTWVGMVHWFVAEQQHPAVAGAWLLQLCSTIAAASGQVVNSPVIKAGYVASLRIASVHHCPLVCARQCCVRARKLHAHVDMIVLPVAVLQ